MIEQQQQAKICNRVIVVSNALPLTITRVDGELSVSEVRDPFPISSALSSMIKEKKFEEYHWIGWPYCEVNADDIPLLKDSIGAQYPYMHPVFLDRKEIKNYYNGYCKLGLWSMLHYQMKEVRLNSKWWSYYVKVNEMFCDKIVTLWREGDFIWVHDYHLMLVPMMVKAKLPNAYIGFFFHSPFPSSELFRILPNRTDLLNGILGSNLIGFQSFDYLRHFKSSCARLLSFEVDADGIEVPGNGTTSHFVKLNVYPIGVNFGRFLDIMNAPDVVQKLEDLSRIFEGKRVIIARDRLDSIGGVPHKLSVIESFFKAHPNWRGKLVFIQVYETPIDTSIESEEQRLLLKTVNETVGRINGLYGTLNYNPIEYINRNVGLEELFTWYRLADIALITPVRDGMNLTSHEYVVSQKDKHGVLILSEFTGAARCLGGSIIVNPFSKSEMIDAILEALEMNQEERQLKHSINFNYVMANTTLFWAKRFLEELHSMEKQEEEVLVPKVNIEQVKQSYKASKGKRLFFLDYDGTLTSLVRHPSLAAPSQLLLDTLAKLTQDPDNIVYVISGRDRKSLEGWLGHLPVGMSCEHGGILRRPGVDQPWEENANLDLSWKETVLDIMRDIEDRTPGSFVEHKQINLTWHYRNSDPEFSEFQAKGLLGQLNLVANKYPLDILPGKKAIEVKPIGINKGTIVKQIISKTDDVDFVLCLGDDRTDEDMFKELMDRDDSYSIKVYSEGCKERQSTLAKAFLDSSSEVLELLGKLA